jgi:sugar phosphate isomerase/epimerase
MSRATIIGATSYVYRWQIGVKGRRLRNPLSAIEVIKRVAEAGLGGVQLCDHLDLDLSTAQREELRVAIRDANVFVELGAATSEPIHLRKMLCLASDLGACLLRIVPNIHRSSRYETVETQIESEAKTIRGVLSYPEANGIVLALENHAGLLGCELRDLVERIDSPAVGVCLDTMNSVALLERPEETLRELGSLARTVHLKDFRVLSSPTSHTVVGTVLGEGIVPFKSLLATLGTNDGIVSYHIEHFIGRCDRESEVPAYEQDALDRSLQFALKQLGFKANDTRRKSCSKRT